jgi:hypothetical protein
MLVWLVLGVLVVVMFGAALACAFALGTSAKRADEAFERELELIRLAARFTMLTEERSPSGRRFFPTPQARRELAETVHEVLEAGTAA